MKKQKKANKKQNKCKEKAKQTGPQGHPLGNGPPLSRKAAFGTWAGGLCKKHQPFPENLCAHSSVDAGTETQTELKLILAHIACEANSST